MLFRVLGSLGFIILRKSPSNFAVQPLIHVAASVKEVSGGSYCDTLMNIVPVLDENLETFSSRIQGPYYPLETVLLWCCHIIKCL